MNTFLWGNPWPGLGLFSEDQDSNPTLAGCGVLSKQEFLAPQVLQRRISAPQENTFWCACLCSFSKLKTNVTTLKKKSLEFNPWKKKKVYNRPLQNGVSTFKCLVDFLRLYFLPVSAVVWRRETSDPRGLHIEHVLVAGVHYTKVMLQVRLFSVTQLHIHYTVMSVNNGGSSSCCLQRGELWCMFLAPTQKQTF